MDIVIPSTESERIVNLLAALVSEFPEVSKALIHTAHEAREGIRITVEPLYPDQTKSQRGYYWKWLKLFAHHIGMTPDEMHDEMLCQAYGSEMHDTPFGWRRRPQQRSSDSNRVEYSLLIDTLIRVASEMNFIVEPPVREFGD